jgi:hypothetical protein
MDLFPGARLRRGEAHDCRLVPPTEGSARYEVVRQETRVLLAILNGALGTSYALPVR